MDKYLKDEWDEFKKHHKNIYNILFHILCGFIYMSVIFLLFKSYKNIALIVYILLLFISKINIYIIFVIFISIYIIINYLIKNNIKSLYLIILFIIFYFLPDLSHYLTNEKTVLNINNITFIKIFLNIFYLLPLSIQCLSN
jgi:hypothetical protein